MAVFVGNQMHTTPNLGRTMAQLDGRSRKASPGNSQSKPECSEMQAAKRPFFIGQCFRDTNELLVRHLSMVIGLFLLLLVPISLLVAACDWDIRVSSLLLLPAVCASIWGIQQRESGHNPGFLRCFAQGLKLAPQLFWLQVISGLGLLAALICLVLPAVWAWVSISLGAALVVAYGRGVDAAITESFQLTKPHFLRLLGFWLMLGFLLSLLSLGLMTLPESLKVSELVVMPAWFWKGLTAILTVGVRAQLLAISHIAGLAVLKQLLVSNQDSGDEANIGLNPIQEHRA